MPDPFDFKEDEPLVTRRPRQRPGGWWPILTLFVVLALLAGGVGFWIYQDRERKDMERLYYLHAVQDHYCKAFSRLGATRQVDDCIATMSRLNTESVNRFGVICPALPLPQTTKTAIVLRIQATSP
jgi:hypothetical protein